MLGLRGLTEAKISLRQTARPLSKLGSLEMFAAIRLACLAKFAPMDFRLEPLVMASRRFRLRTPSENKLFKPLGALLVGLEEI